MTLDELSQTLDDLDCRIVTLTQRNQRYSIKLLCNKNNKVYHHSNAKLNDMIVGLLAKIKKDLEV